MDKLIEKYVIIRDYERKPKEDEADANQQENQQKGRP